MTGMLDFSKIFHQLSKDHSQGGAVKVSLDSNEWPKEWSTVFYKAYPRSKKIPLPRIERHDDFFSLIKNRKSQRDFRPMAIPLETLSSVLEYSCGITREHAKGHSRAQASGGARFPLEVYPLVLRSSLELSSGVYHYNVRDHALDTLWARPFSREDVAELFTYPWIQNASVIFVITGVFQRNQMKYGQRGYRYVMIEAGHIGQNVYLNAAAFDLKCCALGGTKDKNIEKLLDIDGVTESVVYALALG